jgi:DNA polymerase-3 subunit epsilon
MLREDGVETWDDLRQWLASPFAPPRRLRRAWPMPRGDRLAAPHAPGIYRMLRSSGDVLYVGKASSLHHRVNSYFRKQHGVHERTLEMLSQARAVSFQVTPSALEAALLEADEIKRHRPPYNVALAIEHRHVWFARHDLGARSLTMSERCPLGPFPSAETLDQFAALAAGSHAVLGRGRWAPAHSVFDAGFERLRAAHPELSGDGPDPCQRLLRLGTRLWREGRRDRDLELDDASASDGPVSAWTPEAVQVALEWLVLRATLARRRARWLTRLADAAIVWSEPGQEGARLIVVESGDLACSAVVEAGTTPPVPPGHARGLAPRRAAMTLDRFDRLRVLTTELKRLVSAGAPVAVRFGRARPLMGSRLARVLAWV